MKNIAFGLIVILLFACQSETKTTFDLANAKKEIEAANREIAESFNKGDSVGLAAAYSKNGAVMLNNMPAISGKENIISVWGNFFKTGLSNVELTTLEIWGDENFITEEGLFSIISKEGKPVDNGKYMVLWKKEDGKWKLHRDMSNSNLPLVTK